MLSPIAPLEKPSVSAAHPARRVAHARFPDAAQPAHAAPHAPATQSAPVLDPSAAPGNTDLLRDQYLHDRLHRAVQRHRPPALCACQGADAGSVDCLLPLQPYRVAQSTPPVEMRDAPALAAQRQLAVPPIRNTGLDDGFESSRRRRRFGGWP